MKTLFVISKGLNKPDYDVIKQLEESDRKPRVTPLEDALNATLLNENYLDQAPFFRRHFLYSILPTTLAQIIEILFVRDQYDVILCYSEKIGLLYALLRKILHHQTPLILMVSWITGIKKSRLLKAVHPEIDHIILWSRVQYEFAINELGIPDNKISLIKFRVDQKFWRPIGQDATDMICSVGMEMRDYPTLIQALKDLDIPCHIATGAARGEIFDTVKALYDIKEPPSKVTGGRKEPTEPRELYDRSRFVVVPLLPTDTDNGITATLEAMSMGKPVIHSRVIGQQDVIQDGVTSIFVDQEAPNVLREAILELWDNPEQAKLMGERTQKYIEENHNLKIWINNIQNVVKNCMYEEKMIKNLIHSESL